MRYRLATVGDIPAMVRIYLTHLEESARPYPSTSETPDADYSKYLLAMLSNRDKNPQKWTAVVAVDEASSEVIGSSHGLLVFHFLDHPQVRGFVEFLGVDHRVRRRGVAKRLGPIMVRELFRAGALAVECSWVPGSVGGAIWEATGFRPFLIQGVWAGPDWVPRTDLPVIPSGVTIGDANSMPVAADPPKETHTWLSPETASSPEPSERTPSRAKRARGSSSTGKS